jgi:riboflavin synthase
MFTGLVEACGTLVALTPLPKKSGHRLHLASPLFQQPMSLGDSLSVDGVCLTVVALRPGEVFVEAGPETLSRTTLGGLAVGQSLHLERALRLGDRLGGHLVSGHVDGVGEVLTSAARGDSWDLTIGCGAEVLRYVIEKGSIALDGISLTVNSVDSRALSVSLVPHTQSVVNLHKKRVGGRVNIEVDLIGKYVEKLLAPYKSAAPPGARDEARLLEKLKENGFV